jgi:hypothetical protein
MQVQDVLVQHKHVLHERGYESIFNSGFSDFSADINGRATSSDSCPCICLPIITCWDGSTIGPVNGTYVVHSSPTPICPHGQSPMQDRTCLPPCGGSNIAEEFMYKTTKFTDYVFNAGQTICDNRVSNVMPTLYNNQTKQQQFCSGYKVGSTNSAKYDSQGGIICDNENNTGCHWDITNVKV